MAGVENSEVEICTAEKIIGKRGESGQDIEYLVQWKEFPNVDTWEPVEHLF